MNFLNSQHMLCLLYLRSGRAAGHTPPASSLLDHDFLHHSVILALDLIHQLHGLHDAQMTWPFFTWSPTFTKSLGIWSRRGIKGSYQRGQATTWSELIGAVSAAAPVFATAMPVSCAAATVPAERALLRRNGQIGHRHASRPAFRHPQIQRRITGYCDDRRLFLFQ